MTMSAFDACKAHCLPQPLSHACVPSDQCLPQQLLLPPACHHLQDDSIYQALLEAGAPAAITKGAGRVKAPKAVRAGLTALGGMDRHFAAGGTGKQRLWWQVGPALTAPGFKGMLVEISRCSHCLAALRALMSYSFSFEAGGQQQQGQQGGQRGLGWPDAQTAAARGELYGTMVLGSGDLQQLLLRLLQAPLQEGYASMLADATSIMHDAMRLSQSASSSSRLPSGAGTSAGAGAGSRASSRASAAQGFLSGGLAEALLDLIACRLERQQRLQQRSSSTSAGAAAGMLEQLRSRKQAALAALEEMDAELALMQQDLQGYDDLQQLQLQLQQLTAAYKERVKQAAECAELEAALQAEMEVAGGDAEAVLVRCLYRLSAMLQISSQMSRLRAPYWGRCMQVQTLYLHCQCTHGVLPLAALCRYKHAAASTSIYRHMQPFHECSAYKASSRSCAAAC